VQYINMAKYNIVPALIFSEA